VSAALVMFASLVATASAQPAPGLQYLFNACTDDPTKAGGITDASGNDINGTVIDPSFAELTQGPAGNNNAHHLDGVNAADESAGIGITTGVQVDNPNINIFNGPYTCMFWVNRDRGSGEDMIFGSPKPNAPGAGSADPGSLHMGFRGNQ